MLSIFVILLWSVQVTQIKTTVFYFTQPEPMVKEAPREVLARANAKGILDRIGSNDQLNRKDLHGRTNRKAKATDARTPQPQLSASVQSKDQETKGSNTTLYGQQEFTTRRRSSQGGYNNMFLLAWYFLLSYQKLDGKINTTHV